VSELEQDRQDATKDPADDGTVTVIGGVEVDWTSERGQRALDALWRLVRPDARRPRSIR
jgi:hypothetical protein